MIEYQPMGYFILPTLSVFAIAAPLATPFCLCLLSLALSPYLRTSARSRKTGKSRHVSRKTPHAPDQSRWRVGRSRNHGLRLDAADR
ncbi:hypothetical protein BO83DRAFT_21041 [Aspergillus eucalypticola CBS 122712]|uniref:Uncharacterized protein n=1 Tax=Aspergillus eucalypticola (strain CBS 122712 / IBT 29274) TaxID=1448314 RepID=A0A317VLX4_ASPEC|nr:uncharacterized protein BO83DRAFT_21041 [Aspergillus eucalypticola CBS 122712]PWY73938.1 hypothetical protein BO83DRAFT_21041 [Aspergillus eucalypticola CBS 122712]